MLILTLALVLLAIYLSINIIKVLLDNNRGRYFFQIKSPQLPVVPDPSILFGNIEQTTFNNKNVFLIDDWHRKLGKTFGHYYTSFLPLVSTTDIDLIKKIEIDDAIKHLDRVQIELPIKEFKDSIAQINGDDWRRVRRAIAPALTNLRVRSDEVSTDIELVLEQFCAAIERKLDQAEKSTGKREVILDTNNYAKRITLAVVFLLVYKRENEIDFDADMEDEYWTREFTKAGKEILHPLIKVVAALPFLHPVVARVVRFMPVGRVNMRIGEYINRTIDDYRDAKERYDKINGANKVPFSEAKNQPGFKRRLIDGFIDALVDKKVSKDHFVGSSYFLLLAGFETLAATITAMLWLLAQNTDIQTKLRETIISEGIDADYVLWCIMESIRWHPPVPLGIGRLLGEDITTNDGLLIPKGTYVMPSTYSIHHDESIWPEPEKFMPERWRYSSKFHPAAFVGFGLGPRNCVAGKLAIHEVKITLRAILTRYRVEKCEGTPEEYKFISPGLIYTIPEKPVMLKLTPLGRA